MKTRIHYAACPQEYLTAFGLDPARVIYFDIETTGFRASTSRLYMIGWAVKEDASRAQFPPEYENCGGSGDWIVTQIMAQSSAEEVLLLEQFSRVLRLYDTIVEFNGDRFDLPYMREKYESYWMEDPFSHCSTVDLYREIKPYKNLLGMTRLNQKSVERFLNIPREDPFNGGELIDVYRSVRDHSCLDEEGAVNALFLHNYEDVLGMLAMTPLLSYHLAMQSTAPVSIRREEDGSENAGCRVIEAAFALDVPVPRPLHLVLGDQIEDHLTCSEAISAKALPQAACCIELFQDQAVVTLYCLPLNLYHFFPDYRNYYYLPEEDTAIHKSVASFVDASHREKAKAKNCYVKKQGIFLPQAKEHYQPSFQRCYKDCVSWFEYRPQMKEDPDLVSEYVHALVQAARPVS